MNRKKYILLLVIFTVFIMKCDMYSSPKTIQINFNNQKIPIPEDSLSLPLTFDSLDIALDESGYIYIADRNSRAIYRWSPEGSLIDTIGGQDQVLVSLNMVQ